MSPAQLRLVTVPYIDFDGATHTGELVVHADVADDVAALFSRLAGERFPIRQMSTVEQFEASDDASLAVDNTAAFNCRPAVTADGPIGWSEHAYGRAIDVNPIENPYLPGDGRVMPPAGAPYVDRGDYRPGMAGPGTPLNRAFDDAGWAWGGTWSANPDYQHFSLSGR